MPKVKLIHATLTDVMGDDLKAIQMAKVSFNNDIDEHPSGWDDVDLPCVHREQPILTAKQLGLIKFLARGMTSSDYQAMIDQVIDCTCDNQAAELLWNFRNTPTHSAPFGHSFMTFLVEAPVFVARQLVKHEYLRMSEVSRRYVKGDPVYWKPDSWRGIAENVKQGSGSDLPQVLQDDAKRAYTRSVESANESYKHLLDFVSPEEARIVLPLCHMTRFYWSGSLDAFADMCNLRLDDHAQLQTRVIAEDISRQTRQAFPASWSALVGGLKE